MITNCSVSLQRMLLEKVLRHAPGESAEQIMVPHRFKDNPLVTGPPSIRFYAGAPLVTSNGMRLGSLCVIDVKPRNLDAEQLMVLANFAEVVVREIEKDIARVRPCRLPNSCPNCGQQGFCWQTGISEWPPHLKHSLLCQLKAAPQCIMCAALPR